ncbi:Uncharacterised protein [Burkholderia pseudomallei]|nr:Uncharacterised protein [Burkholderia pseudomallei]
MAVEKEIKGIEEFSDYLDRKGDLHDCMVELIQWHPEAKSVDIKFLDVNANFLGLPEYEGLTPCVMRISDIHEINFNLVNHEGMLRVYEASISNADGYGLFKMLFSPSGSMSLLFADIELLEIKADRN